MATIDEVNKTIRQLKKSRKVLKKLAKKHIKLKEAIQKGSHKTLSPIPLHYIQFSC